MKCPHCNVDLSMSDRQGIEIDYCPQCRGIWLDRGELDKLIERAGRYEQKESNAQPKSDRYDDYRDTRGRRPKSWLSELFD